MSKEWKTAHLFGLEANTVSVGRHFTLWLSYTDLSMNHVLRKGICLCHAGGAKEVGRQHQQNEREAAAEGRAGQKSNWGTVAGFRTPAACGGLNLLILEGSSGPWPRTPPCFETTPGRIPTPLPHQSAAAPPLLM